MTEPENPPRPGARALLGRDPAMQRLARLMVVVALVVVAFAAGTSVSHWSQSRTGVNAVAAELGRSGVMPGMQTEGFADLVARVRPAVVAVQVQIQQPGTGRQIMSDSPFERFFGLGSPGAPAARQGGPTILGEGSGFFISPDGYAVTNNHVVDHAQVVQVTTDDGSVYAARVVGTDPESDLAVIKVDANTRFPSVNFAEQAPRVGDWVLAVGNPFGLGNTVTAGIVSALGRDIGANRYDRFVQIDAPINRGNSGGPTFDLDGNVVGVNAMIYSPSGGSVGIGFDIPADTAKAVTASLMKYGRPTRGWLGAQL